MSRRVHLPPIETPVEAPEVVRPRAAHRIRLVGGLLMVLLFGTGARGVHLSLSPVTFP